MGSGSTAYRAAMGQAAAELDYLTKLIPVQEQQAQSELKIRQQAFEQELAQAEKLGLLSQKLSATQTQPVYVTQTTAATDQTKPNYLLLIIIGIAAIFLIKRKGKIL